MGNPAFIDGFLTKTSIDSGFPIVMFDYRRVYLCIYIYNIYIYMYCIKLFEYMM